MLLVLRKRWSRTTSLSGKVPNPLLPTGFHLLTYPPCPTIFPLRSKMQDPPHRFSAFALREGSKPVVQAIARPPSQSQLVYNQLRAALRDGTFGGGELLTESDL